MQRLEGKNREEPRNKGLQVELTIEEHVGGGHAFPETLALSASPFLPVDFFRAHGRNLAWARPWKGCPRRVSMSTNRRSAMMVRELRMDFTGTRKLRPTLTCLARVLPWLALGRGFLLVQGPRPAACAP